VSATRRLTCRYRYTIETHNLDGCGPRAIRVYHPTPVPGDYVAAVTDIPCPRRSCPGSLEWAEAGYVPYSRICDTCREHYQADGTDMHPLLLRVGRRSAAAPSK